MEDLCIHIQIVDVLQSRTDASVCACDNGIFLIRRRAYFLDDGACVRQIHRAFHIQVNDMDGRDCYCFHDGFTSLPHTRKHHSHGWFYTLFLSFLSHTWCFALDLYVSPAIAYFLYIVRYKYTYQFNVTHNITRSWSHRCFFFSFSLVFITAVRYGHANSRSE